MTEMRECSACGVIKETEECADCGFGWVALEVTDAASA